jgi:hypothetical protein
MRTLCGVLLCALPALALAAADKDPPLFDPDADHPWNGAHRALYEADPRRDIDDQEQLEPLITSWPDSRFLAPRASPKPALEALDALLAAGPKARVKDPLRRAVFQHDLWAAFSDSTGPASPTILEQADGRTLNTQIFEDRGDADLPRRRERRELQRRLVQAMRLAALTEDEIKGLPDNLADAVKSGRFPREFDPKKPEQAFLPADLLARDGPWVVVHNTTETHNLGAPTHLASFKGRSVFTVLLRLPGGRKATEAFVKELEKGKLPPLPRGTQTALLRRMLLIDDQGMLRPTPLTESLQLRTFSGDDDTGEPTAFKLSRAGLFAGKGDGLRALNLKGRNCVSCHARTDGNGVRSITSLFQGDRKRPGLTASDLEEQTRRSIDWTEKSYTWGLLQGLWEAGPAK